MTSAHKPLGVSRDQGIETLRGIAVVLMVAGHVIGDHAEAGMRVADDSLWRYAYFALAPFRLPLFTVISGFVYALRPAVPGGVFLFMRGKVRRLGVPLFVVGGAFVLVQALVPGTNTSLRLEDVPRVIIYPYAHFWYLYALFWVFLVVAQLDALRLLHSLRHWSIALAVAASLSIFRPIAWAELGIGQAFFLLPYFLLGVGMQRFSVLHARRLSLSALPLLLGAIILHQGTWFGLWTLSPRVFASVTTLFGLLSTFAVLSFRVPSTSLSRMGYYSYGIYLMHVFGTAAARIVLGRMGVDQPVVQFVASLTAGVFFPVLAERVIAPSAWLSFLVLGKRMPNIGPGQPTLLRSP